MPLLPYLHRIAERENLTSTDAREAMLLILSGQVSTPIIASFLVALRMKGETADEIFGFAQAMRERATRVDAGLDGETLLDTCGTGGGEGESTFNISTVAAFVAAGAGVKVAKHGNRSLSSQCGSADILEALGVRITLDAERIAQAIREVGIGFLFAPMFHPAMKFAQPARQELKMRTVFNLLGPLTNPAGAVAQLIGAPSMWAAELMAAALHKLEAERAIVVHGTDGLDEVTITGPTAVYDVCGGGAIRKVLWHPANFGVEPCTSEALRGGDRQENCDIATRILHGERGAQRDIVLVNAAAALFAANAVETLAQGADRARESIDSGAAWRKVELLIEFTNSFG